MTEQAKVNHGARKTPVPRVWPTETKYTGRITARIPIGLRDWLREYAEEHGKTTTDVVVAAIDEYLRKRMK